MVQSDKTSDAHRHKSLESCSRAKTKISGDCGERWHPEVDDSARMGKPNWQITLFSNWLNIPVQRLSCELYNSCSEHVVVHSGINSLIEHA